MEVLVPASSDVGAVSLNGRYIDVHLSYGDVHESQQQSLVIDLATSTIRWVPMTQQVVFDHGVAIGIRHLPPGRGR